MALQADSPASRWSGVRTLPGYPFVPPERVSLPQRNSMFDPATLGASLQPGDKVAMTFHKGQPKQHGPTFMDNVNRQNEAVSRPAVMPGMGGPNAGPMGVPSTDPSADRQALIHAMRARMAAGPV